MSKKGKEGRLKIGKGEDRARERHLIGQNSPPPDQAVHPTVEGTRVKKKE